MSSETGDFDFAVLHLDSVWPLAPSRLPMATLYIGRGKSNRNKFASLSISERKWRPFEAFPISIRGKEREEGRKGRWNYPKTRCPTYTENDLLHIGWQTGGGLASGIG